VYTDPDLPLTPTALEEKEYSAIRAENRKLRETLSEDREKCFNYLWHSCSKSSQKIMDSDHADLDKVLRDFNLVALWAQMKATHTRL